MSVFANLKPTPFRSEMGIIKIRESSSGQTAYNVRVVWLPVSVIAFADDGIRDRIKESGFLAAPCLCRIARVLFEPRGEDYVSEKLTETKSA